MTPISTLPEQIQSLRAMFTNLQRLGDEITKQTSNIQQALELAASTLEACGIMLNNIDNQQSIDSKEP